jgi:hypothetical protein
MSKVKTTQEAPCGCWYRHGLRIALCRLHATEEATRALQREQDRAGEDRKFRCGHVVEDGRYAGI